MCHQYDTHKTSYLIVFWRVGTCVTDLILFYKDHEVFVGDHGSSMGIRGLQYNY